MDGTRVFELKVGAFILLGIVILFIIVFSIGDINLSKSGYKIRVTFNFANGLAASAPVRLAGVDVGHIQAVRIMYDEIDKRTKAEVSAWVYEDTKIGEDAKITINTLGLLGEKYMEISVGTPGKPILKPNDIIAGKDPMPMEKITEDLADLSDSVKEIVGKLKKGEGTIGKLLVEDVVYNDLKATAANFKEFSEDIKKHPWKVLAKPRGDK